MSKNQQGPDHALDAIIHYPNSIKGGVQKVANKAMNKIAPGSSVVLSVIKKRKDKDSATQKYVDLTDHQGQKVHFRKRYNRRGSSSRHWNPWKE